MCVSLVILNANAVRQQELMTNLEDNITRLVVDELEPHHTALVDYTEYLLCMNDSIRFIHVYVELSLTTSMGNRIINRLNECMTAGISTSR